MRPQSIVFINLFLDQKFSISMNILCIQNSVFKGNILDFDYNPFRIIEFVKLKIANTQ